MIDSGQEAFYIEWLNNRFTVIYDGIKEVFGENFLENKTLLELGAFNGNFGYKFHEKGAIVTCYEAREENLNRLKQLHPNFESHLKNMDVDKIEKNMT